MKKFGQIVLVFLLSVGMFTGCGTSYKADESTVFVLKDGKIVSTDVENFDEKTYDKDGLKEYVKNEIDTYNEKNGKGSVSLKKLDTGEKKATLTIAYRTAEDYQKFNDMELYTGSVAEALAAGYSFDGSFASVKNGKIKACESSAFLDDSSCKVVVIRGNTNVKVKGTICYVSTTNTSYVDAQTIAIKEGTSLLAAEKTTEGTESATEAAGTQTEETTGAVSDDDLIDVTEQESEVKFQFDEENLPKAVAGCPPDAFAETGQLWGNPLYRWEYHRQTGYEWWLQRLSHCFKLYDAVRIDHFRGFDQYYSIPYGAETAITGHWEQGPGIDLFNRVRQVLGEKEVIAEDLGYVTDSVRKLVHDSGFPGMKVLEFAFDSRDSGCASDYLPHNYPENSVAYTGTHDNETLAGWFDSITKEEQELVRDYLCDHYTPKKYLYRSLNSLVMRSKAALCVIPMQDHLGLDNRYRMNKPSTVGENWKWRLKKGDLTDQLKAEIRGMTRRYGRLNGQ
jgi:hypothetical protein